MPAQVIQDNVGAGYNARFWADVMNAEGSTAP